MDIDQNTLSFIALGISSGAFIISFASLWRAYYKRFKPLIIAGPLSMRIIRVKAGNKKCFHAVLQCKIDITNSGAKTGIIRDFRIRAAYPYLGIRKAHEDFSWIAEIDPVKFNSVLPDYFKALDDALIAEDGPFIVQPKQTITKNMFFSISWYEPVIQSIEFRLDAVIDKKRRWKTYEEWFFPISVSDWRDMVEDENINILNPGSHKPISNLPVPEDLHDYTKSKEKIPYNGFGKNPKFSEHGYGPNNSHGHSWIINYTKRSRLGSITSYARHMLVYHILKIKKHENH